jgi:hypothetical protein
MDHIIDEKTMHMAGDNDEKELQWLPLSWRNLLIIGLGKIGSKVVDTAAKRFEEKEKVEKSQNIQFVAINTNEKDKKQRFSHRVIRIELGISPGEIGDNAGSTNDDFVSTDRTVYRCFGKAAYSTEKDRILDHMGKIVETLFCNTRNSNIFVALVTHCGDGMGSGIVTEFAVDLYKKLSSQHYNVFFMGVGLLSSQKQENNEELANTHATLKELHFLMSQKELAPVNNILNPFSIFFLVDDETISDKGERSDVIADFLCDTVMFADDFLNTLWEKTRGYTHQFSTFGHFRCQFPICKLLNYYNIEFDILNKEKEKKSIEYQISEKNKELNNIENTLYDVKDQIKNFNILLESKKKNIMSFAHKDEIREIEDQKAEALRKEKEIYQKKVQIKETVTSLKQKKLENLQKIDSVKPLKDRLFSDLSNPTQSMQYYTIPIHLLNIEKLREERDQLADSCVLDIMQRLEREEEFYRKTHENNVNNKIIPAPMLDYIIKFSKKDYWGDFPEKLIQILFDYDLFTEDREGMLNINDTKNEKPLALTLTYKGNYDAEKLNFQGIDSIAKRSSFSVKTVPLDERKRFCFDIYFFLIGLRPWSPFPDNLPPRLRTLILTRKAYEREIQSKHISEYHTLSPGYPQYSSDSPGEGEQFWSLYKIVDDDAKVFYLIVLLYNFVLFADELTQYCEKKEELFNLLAPEQFESHMAESLLDQLKAFESYCVTFKKSLEQKRKELDRYQSRLKDHYNELKSVRFQQEISFPERVEGLEKDFEQLLRCIKTLQNFYNKTLHEYTEDINRSTGFEKGTILQRDKALIEEQIKRINKESVKISLFLNKLTDEINKATHLIHEVCSL